MIHTLRIWRCQGGASFAARLVCCQGGVCQWSLVVLPQMVDIEHNDRHANSSKGNTNKRANDNATNHAPAAAVTCRCRAQAGAAGVFPPGGAAAARTRKESSRPGLFWPRSVFVSRVGGRGGPSPPAVAKGPWPEPAPRRSGRRKLLLSLLLLSLSLSLLLSLLLGLLIMIIIIIIISSSRRRMSSRDPGISQPSGGPPPLRVRVGKGQLSGKDKGGPSKGGFLKNRLFS